MPRLECEDDKVVQGELVLVCTTIGWGPTPPPEFPACKPNVCPSLLDKSIREGAWECQNHNASNCNNQRTGQVCSLKCEESYKVGVQCNKI